MIIKAVTFCSFLLERICQKICQQIWKYTVATALEKVSFHSNPKEKQCQRMFKLPHNHTHLTHQQSNAQTSQSKASKVHKRKTFRFKSKQTKSFQMFKLDLDKAEEPEIKLPTSIGSQKKQEKSRKASTSALLTMLKPLMERLTANSGKFLKR